MSLTTSIEIPVRYGCPDQRLAIQAELREQLFAGKPFPYLQVTDFLQDPELIKNLELELPKRVGTPIQPPNPPS